MKRLSIVHLTTFLQGGAGRAITDLACEQHAAGHRVLVASSLTNEAGYENYPHYLDRLHDAGVPVVLVDSLFKRDQTLNVVALDRIRDAARSGAVDIVHAHAGTPARIGMRYSRASHSTSVLQTQHGWGTNKTARQAAEDLEALREVDCVVATSEATRSQLIDLGLQASHVLTIPCGIASSVGGPVPSRAAGLVAAYRSRGCQVVACVGTVNANKNQRIVLDALALMKPRAVACIFIGEGGAALTQQAVDAGIEDRIVTVGYQEDAEQWLPAFDAIVVPSLSEGQGLVVLEAFRAGVPVVASDIAPLRQMVIDGDTGWLFDPRDEATLAGALARALDAAPDHRERMIAQARRVFQRSFTTDHMVAQYERLYRELCRIRADRMVDAS